jgi:hypothetical protein
MNWGHGNQGLRLQKQGATCVLSGMIRVSKRTVNGKKFWHQAESLIQLSDGAASEEEAGRRKWGNLAFIPRKCRPSSTVKFTVNNHILPAKIKIGSNGRVIFASGGTKHGWISLSGVVWKAAGRLSKDGRGISRQTTGRLITANGWKPTRAYAYKQGSVCMLSGSVTRGRNWKSRILTLPKFCRPRYRHSFAMSQGRRTFRVDVTASGAVIAKNVPNRIRSRLDLNSIVFSTKAGKALKLYKRRGWKRPKRLPGARVARMGSLCIVSGYGYNHRVRNGNKEKLKNGGAVGRLPVWCRPQKRLTFSTVAPNGRLQRIDVLRGGQVRWEGGRRDKMVGLTGVKFNVPSKTVQKYSKNMLKVTKCRL